MFIICIQLTLSAQIIFYNMSSQMAIGLHRHKVYVFVNIFYFLYYSKKYTNIIIIYKLKYKCKIV